MRQKHSLGIAKLQNKETDFIVQSGDKMIEASDEINVSSMNYNYL